MIIFCHLDFEIPWWRWYYIFKIQLSDFEVLLSDMVRVMNFYFLTCLLGRVRAMKNSYYFKWEVANRMNIML